MLIGYTPARYRTAAVTIVVPVHLPRKTVWETTMRSGLAFGLVSMLWLVSCSGGKPTEISFGKDIRPLLNAYCAECHTPAPTGVGYAQTQFSTETYESLMRGTQLGPVIRPGDAKNSIIVSIIAGKADPRLRMPHARGPLPAYEINVLSAWVAQGAKNN